MTDGDIKRLRELAQAATPGPWAYRALPDGAHGVTHPHGWVDVVMGLGEQEEADVRYIIAASPDVLLALLDRLERDAARLDWLERQANQPGGMLLHDGSESGRLGLGLRPGAVTRDLRTAIDVAMRVGSGGSGA